jgi:hypothetical protein
MVQDGGGGMARRERVAATMAKREHRARDPVPVLPGRDVDFRNAQETATAPEDSTAQDWLVADAVRRDFDDETVDGLSLLEEEVRRAAEDLVGGERWEERVRRKADELWEAEGGPHGRAEDHWRRAAQLVAEEIAGGRTDLPYPGDRDGPAEQAALQDNLGEFPSLADQGREEPAPAAAEPLRTEP